MRRIKFWQFIDEHPEYLNSFPFTDAEKSRIYNWFFNRYVDEEEFGRSFLITVQYNWNEYTRLKSIDILDKIADLTTSKRVREIANNTLNNLSRTANTTTNKTTQTSETVSGTSHDQSANKQLPMNSSGDDFDDLFDWSKGGSGIGENQGSNRSTVTGGDTITGSDAQTLTDIGNRTDRGTITDTETNELMADVLDRIWNYILGHEPMQWLLGKLQVCFLHKINIEE